jgi:hypothetical protein
MVLNEPDLQAAFKRIVSTNIKVNDYIVMSLIKTVPTMFPILILVLWHQVQTINWDFFKIYNFIDDNHMMIFHIYLCFENHCIQRHLQFCILKLHVAFS